MLTPEKTKVLITPPPSEYQHSQCVMVIIMWYSIHYHKCCKLGTQTS